MMNPMRFRVAIAAGIAGVFLALAVVSAVTWRPRADEGFFASPALNLVRTGSMGTPIMPFGPPSRAGAPAGPAEENIEAVVWLYEELIER